MAPETRTLWRQHRLLPLHTITTKALTGAGTDDPDLEGIDRHKRSAMRYERTSELIKALEHSCSRAPSGSFYSLEMELPEFTAVLDETTRNTNSLVIVHDSGIGQSKAFHSVGSTAVRELLMPILWLLR